jgi:hypothetical protein
LVLCHASLQFAWKNFTPDKNSAKSGIVPSGYPLVASINRSEQAGGAVRTGMDAAIRKHRLKGRTPAMNVSYADDCRIETRFVWARCAAENARAMRELIRAFQNDGWTSPRDVVSRKKQSRRTAHR